MSLPAGCFKNVSILVLGFEIFLFYVHLTVIQIAMFLFLSIPLSFYLALQTLKNFRKSRTQLLLFAITLFFYTLIAYFLAYDQSGNIIFNPEPVVNLTFISHVVLIEASLLFLYELYRNRIRKSRDFLSYLGFASSIPWVSPLIVELLFLVRWALLGIFDVKTQGKAVGGAGWNDVLFLYGFRNLTLSMLVFLVLFVLISSFRRRRETKEEQLNGRAEI